MTLKDEEPPLVPATLIETEPEYNLHASAPPASVAQPYVVQGAAGQPYVVQGTTPVAQGVTSASVSKPATMVQGVSSLPSQPPSTPTYPTGSTTTSTTYTIPAPAQQSAPATTYGNLGRSTCRITCQYCHNQCNTRTHDRIDAVTILLVIVLLLVFWPLFWLPLVIPCCKTTEHCCGHCNRVVGRTEPCD